MPSIPHPDYHSKPSAYSVDKHPGQSECLSTDAMQLDQGATKITRRATDNTAALNAFMAAKREIDGMLARIKTLSDDHFETDPGGIHWGDVGTLNHYCSVLPDAALPSALTAEWQVDEANADTPYPSYARMLSQMGTPGADSPVSWTVDFAARREKAREEMKPLLDQARQGSSRMKLSTSRKTSSA